MGNACYSKLQAGPLRVWGGLFMGEEWKDGGNPARLQAVRSLAWERGDLLGRCSLVREKSVFCKLGIYGQTLYSSFFFFSSFS